MAKALRIFLVCFSIAILWLVPFQVTDSASRDVLSPAWEIGVQDDLAAREYWVTWQDRTQLDNVPAAWHAPNRAQGFRTYFTRAVQKQGRPMRRLGIYAWIGYAAAQ